MNYRKDKYGNPISILGFGCMRFTQSGGKIDLDKAEREILEAIQSGVNYFDTAYVYPGSEDALGRILEKNHLRDQVSIATKLPHYLLRKPGSFEKYFSEELKRLRTDRVDYYLMHMLTDVKTWERLKSLGIVEWLREKQRSGAIRQVGFSYHGNSEMFCQLVDAYDWDFCQIQYNYLDEHSQAGRRGLQYAASKQIPVMIMEPLRGGKLVGLLPDEARQLFADYPVRRSPAEWAFRWLWNQPEVTCVLSGMNSLDMVRENVKTASAAQTGELTQADQALLRSVVQAINRNIKVGCTGCGYCMPCPKQVDIPGTFAAYNRMFTEGKRRAKIEYIMCTAMRKDSAAASNCIGCGACERHCPQQLPIREELKNARKALEGPMYAVARKGIQLLKLYG